MEENDEWAKNLTFTFQTNNPLEPIILEHLSSDPSKPEVYAKEFAPFDGIELDANGDPIWHYWMGDVRLPGNWPKDGIPCWRYDPSKYRERGDGKGSLAITIDKALVTCQDCLELIHS